MIFPKRIGLGLATLTLAFTALAQEAIIRKNIAQRFPDLQQIDEVTKSPIPGIYELRVNGAEIYYSDASGNYLMVGNLYATKEHRNLTEERVNKLTAVKFDSLPFKDAFTIVRGTGERKLAVFEDPNCGYCKHFERELQNVSNVTIYMFLFPILGQDSVDKAKVIWCGKEKAQIWQDWMVREKTPPSMQPICDTSALQRNVEFGRAYRINGTPTLFFSNGTRVPGAIDAKQIEKHFADAAS